MCGLGLAAKIYLALEAVDMRKGFEGLLTGARSAGTRPVERTSVPVHESDASESAGVGVQRIVGVRQAPGEGRFHWPAPQGLAAPPVPEVEAQRPISSNKRSRIVIECRISAD